jgi:hypothetical protein
LEVHDRDPLFTTCERVIGTLRRELLDQILILGERHLVLVLREYVIHYDRHRPHQSGQQRPPDIETQPVHDVADLRAVRRKPVVAGVINEYHHASSPSSTARTANSAPPARPGRGPADHEADRLRREDHRCYPRSQRHQAS